jgi:acyl-CoA-binding protein
MGESNKTKRELLDEADKLLYIAWTALCKMRLRGRGSDCGLSHEVRMFALSFSHEEREGPGELQINGNGRYQAWRENLEKVAATGAKP